MDETNVKLSFGGKTKTPAYYQQILEFVDSLRATTSQSIIAARLTQAGFRTPRGLTFDRQRLANFLRNTNI